MKTINVLSRLGLYFLLIISIACTSNTEPDIERENERVETPNKEVDAVTWIDFEYDSAQIYLYALEGEEKDIFMAPIVIDNELNVSVVSEKTATLKSSEIKTVDRIMGGVTPDQEESLMIASCFEPHHGIVFYKSDSIAAHISFCMMCGTIRSNPDNNGKIDVSKFRSLLKKHDLPLFDNFGDIENYLEKSNQE